MRDTAELQEAADALFHDIQRVLTGHKEDVILHALTGALATVVGIVTPDRATAEEAINELPKVLHAMLEAEWDKLRAHRAKMTAANDEAPPSRSA